MRILLLVSLFFAQSAWDTDHPGNIFLAGDDVRVTVPKTWAGWRAIDIDRKEVGNGKAGEGTAELGKLPVGYFEIHEKDGPGMVTTAVLAKSTFSDDTPIALDTGISWFYSDPKQIRDACEICKLAGVKWVRDRLSWPEIETARGIWAGDTRYEKAMRIEHESGLKILQVNHISPPWASKDTKHFPDDLRDVYNFYRGLAKRWNGLADAIEPWNEADIVEFGGHTGCEIASFQKAAYLGLKTGNSAQPVNAAVFAIDRPETLDEFGANEVYPYFDRYDLHHYIKLTDFARAYGRHRAISGGRPMWTTEFNLNIFWSDEKTKELSEGDLRIQAFRVSKAFSEALSEGTQKAFYFVFGHYVERTVVYGLVHTDLTPRPSYVAFAAVGRFLNGAKPIGRVDLGNEKLMGYVFRTVVDGAERETLLTWSETQPVAHTFPAFDKAYDYLGRELSTSRKIELDRPPVFLVAPRGWSKDMKIKPPPAKAKWLAGKPCSVVLQLLGKGDFKQSAFQLDETNELKLVAYNFGDKPAHGKLSVEGAKAAKSEIELAPGTREELTIKAEGPGKVTAKLDLGGDGHAIVTANVLRAQLKNCPAPKAEKAFLKCSIVGFRASSGHMIATTSNRAE
jgi:uncharacterized cupredoxin-like copper-binding protein